MERLNHALSGGQLAPLLFLDRVNALLKHLLIHGYGETHVASLSSDEWAFALGEFLHRQSAQRVETSLLGEFRYRPHRNPRQADILLASERLGADLKTALRRLQPPRIRDATQNRWIFTHVKVKTHAVAPMSVRTQCPSSSA